MTHDPGGDLRERFKTASLPPAPVRLRERLAAVASAPGATTMPRFGLARLVMAAAAVFAIASIGLVAGGGLDDPGPSLSTLTAEATAEPTAEATPETTAEPFPFRLVCEEAEAPAPTCAEVAAAVVDAVGNVGAGLGRIVEIAVTRPCDTPCLSAAWSVQFVITFASAHVMDGSLGPGGVFQLMSSETDAPTK